MMIALVVLLGIAGNPQADALPIDSPFEQFHRDSFVTGSPEENDVLGLAIDKEKVWAVSRAGVRQIVNGRFVTPQGTVGGPCLDIDIDADGRVWIAAWDGLYLLAKNHVQKIEGIEGPVRVVRSIGQTTVAAAPNGIHRRGGEESWSRIPASLPACIHDIQPLGGSLLLSTDVGLWELSDDNATRVVMPPQLPSRVVQAVAVDLGSRSDPSTADAVIHVGTSAGIGSVRRIASEWKVLDRKRPILPFSDVHRLLVVASGDSDAEEWLATSGGLIRVANQGGSGARAQLFHSRRWLPHDDCHDLALGDDGSLWVATAGGVAIIKKKPMTLAEKADYLERMIRARHVRPPGLVERVQLTRQGDLASWRPVDTDNDGEYTGTYLVAEAYRYAVTKSPEAKRFADEAFDAMEFLQTVTGTPGFVARTVVPAHWTQLADENRSFTARERALALVHDHREKIVERRWRLSDDLQWLWKGDTSSDEITGHLYAYGVYYDLVADDAQKKRVAALVKRIVDGIIEGGFVLRDLDGLPTRWGVWSPEKLNDDPNWSNERGVNSVEILSFLTTAKYMTGEPAYDRHIDSLLWEKGYSKNIQEPRPTDPGGYTYIDDELLAMAYRGLVAYEKDPKRSAVYRKSLDAWFQSVRRDASPCYNFIYAELTGVRGTEILQNECAALLRDVPLDMIHWTVDNTRREDIQLVRRPQSERWQTSRLLPPSEIPVLRWDNNPYAASGGENGHAEMCPAFWLWGYWLGRYHHLVGSPAP